MNARTMTFREAIRGALAEEMRADSRIVMIGENLHVGLPSLVSAGLVEEFGPRRVIETPVAENAIVGGSLGLALAGMIPVGEIQSADFIFTAANEVVNDIPKWRFQHGGERTLPVILRGPCGAAGGFGPEHSQCVEGYLVHVPGLTTLVPGTPADAAGLMRAALRSGKPVVFFEHRKLYEVEGPVPTDPDFTVPIGAAEVARRGDDVTVVAWGRLRGEGLVAADILAEDGISAEVVDLRTIAPMDVETIVDSVNRTGRLVVAEEAPTGGGVGSEVVAAVVERSTAAFHRVARVAMPHVPHPYAPSLEACVIPEAGDIVEAVRSLVNGAEQRNRARRSSHARSEPWSGRIPRAEP